MAWPTDQDYNEAIQNPRIAFADQELQSGQVELNAMGIPKARSGNFATVYKVVAGSTAHAVRCFRYDHPEHNIRYPAIAAYVTQITLPYMVPFRYMPQGIRVGASWYPFVRMRWVEGDSLVSYIEKNLSSPSALNDLAAAWARMLMDLRQAKIAHGDLQHGNVLVVQGKLRLVDYDGMYVPALDGSRGIELGHRNYQHPQRAELDFGPQLDNFSAWSIYASLVALAVQPSLWGQLKGGDECLLFRKEDFDSPERSAAFRLLKALPDAKARALAGLLKDFLWLTPDQVPAISDQEIATQTAGHSLTSPPSTPSWIQDYTKEFATETADDFPIIEAGDQSWIEDYVEQKTDVGSFSNNVHTDRLIALSALLTAFAFCAWFSFFNAPLLAAVVWFSGIAGAYLVTVGILRIRYRAEPVFATIKGLRSDLTRLTKEHDEVRHVFEELKAKRLWAGVNSLASELEQVTARRDRELRTALKDYQDEIVNSHLQRIRLADANVPGIGPQLKERLAVAGFVSAGDIGTRSQNVPGIGLKKWAALYAWRRHVQGPIRAREAPKSLPLHKTASIEHRYEAQIRHLQQNLAQEQTRLSAAQQNVKARILGQKRTLDDQFNKAIETAAKRVREVSWRRNQAERRCLAYNSLSFRRYALRVIGRL